MGGGAAQHAHCGPDPEHEHSGRELVSVALPGCEMESVARAAPFSGVHRQHSSPSSKPFDWPSPSASAAQNSAVQCSTEPKATPKDVKLPAPPAAVGWPTQLAPGTFAPFGRRATYSGLPLTVITNKISEMIVNMGAECARNVGIHVSRSRASVKRVSVLKTKRAVPHFAVASLKDKCVTRHVCGAQNDGAELMPAKIRPLAVPRARMSGRCVIYARSRTLGG